jgi:hypothetical protein
MKKDRNLLTNNDDGNEAQPANALRSYRPGTEKVDDGKGTGFMTMIVPTLLAWAR